MIVKKYCAQCGKQAKFSREYDINEIHFVQYECGHVSGKKHPNIKDFSSFKSLDGHSPYKFQVEGAVFGLKSQGRFAILDEMGLGKTIQALMVAHGSGEKFLILCKAGLKIQWARECFRWLDESIVQIIEAEDEFIVRGARGYILSFDMLWRFKDIPSFIQRLGTNFVILDEVQHIKNSNTKRTNGVRVVCQTVDFVAALSGKAVENNAEEFFTLLNLLRPDKFPERKKFQMQFVNSYWSGYSMKFGGIKNFKAFKEYTSDIIIRRTRDEVLPDLPKINRQYLYTDLGGSVEEAYKELMKDYLQFFNYGSIGMSTQQKQANILAYLAKMRHLTGCAKIEPTIEYIQDFLSETDRKITVFLHHIDVGKIIYDKLRQEGINALTIQDVKAEDRQSVIDQFRDDPNQRVLIASTLASGEGLNLQFCADCIILEREWNPSKEEQAEARFPRPGQTADKINATYPTAVGTVDEYLAELVEKKREYCNSALDGSEVKWDEASIIKELAEILALKGGKKWGW